jgi:hypothetical protein
MNQRRVFSKNIARGPDHIRLKQITALIATKVSSHTAEPFLRALINNGAFLHVVAPQELFPVMAARLGEASFTFDDIAFYRKKTRCLRLLHKCLILLLTPSDFSAYYTRKIDTLLSGRQRVIAWLLRKLLQLLPKCKKEDVNRHVRAIMQVFSSNHFPTRQIIAVSSTGIGHLLCSKGQEVYTIMESWDHPSKQPVGFTSHKVFVWNEELRRDWMRNQGDSDVSVGYPVKLHYALKNHQHLSKRRRTDTITKIVYPASFSRNSVTNYFMEELALICELCVATRDKGVVLFLKPKPNGRGGEFDSIKAKFPHVQVGFYQQAGTSTDYELDDNYNRRRFDEVSDSDLIINLGTTFAIDAAAMGLPILQLNVMNPVKYPLITKILTYSHLQDYFLKRRELTFLVTNDHGINDVIEEFWRNESYRQKADEFSGYLKQWISPEQTLESATLAVVRECLIGNSQLFESPSSCK